MFNLDSSHGQHSAFGISKTTDGADAWWTEKRGAITRGLDFDAEAVVPTIVVMLKVVAVMPERIV